MVEIKVCTMEVTITGTGLLVVLTRTRKERKPATFNQEYHITISQPDLDS
jgi:hypothetical protein